MGRFIREQLAREGVDMRGVITDPERLTALVILGIRDREQFPLIFYREDCADMALCEADVDEALVRSARARGGDGTHLQPSAHRGGGARRRCASPARPAAGWCSTSTIARCSGACRPRRGREPVRRQRNGHRHPATGAASVDLIVGTEEENPHPRRLDRHDRGAARRARGVEGDAGLQARPPALSPSPARSRRGSTTANPARASRSRCSTCWAPATPS